MYQFIDYYSLLEIAPDASVKDIEAAFTKEAREWQPYMYYGVSDDVIMRYLVDAKRILLNVALRASYDKEYWALEAKGMLPDPITKNDLTPSEYSHDEVLDKRAQGKIRYDILEHKKFSGTSLATVGYEPGRRQSTYSPDIELSETYCCEEDKRVKLETVVYDAFIDLISSPIFQKISYVFIVGFILYLIKR